MLGMPRGGLADDNSTFCTQKLACCNVCYSALRFMFHCVHVPRGVMADENGTFCTHTLSLTQTGCDDASISSPRASPYVLDTHTLSVTHTRMMMMIPPTPPNFKLNSFDQRGLKKTCMQWQRLVGSQYPYTYI